MNPADLRKILRYDKSTGSLFWKTRPRSMFKTKQSCDAWNTRYAGKEALATPGRNGVEHGSIFGKSFSKHRVIWALVKGEWPTNEIDHKDGDNRNNRWSNLREATRLQNSRNRKSFRGSSSKYIGVSWNKKSSKWQASINIRPQTNTKYLGMFTDETEAAKAYDQAAKTHHGDFARLNF